MGPFDRAAITLGACRAVLWRLTEDDLSRPSPCTEYTVGEVGQHVVRSMVLLASVASDPAAGLAAGPVGPAAGSLEEQVAVTTGAALAAWRRRGVGGTVAVGRSTLPADLAFEIIPMELLVHGWDIARATSQQYRCDDEALAEHVLSTVQAQGEMFRKYQGFADIVAVPDTAPTFDRALALSGRDPSWTP